MSDFFGREYNYDTWVASVPELDMFREMAHAGNPAPEFTLPILDGDGQTVTLSQLRDKPVMIEFGSIT